METSQAERTTPTERFRLARRIEPFVTDYLPDDESMPYDQRVAFYRLLKDGLGIHAVRTEFRMNRLIKTDRSFSDTTAASYRDSLKAIKDAELGDPTLVLFTPAKWMEEEAKTSPDQFMAMYRSYAEKIAAICRETGTQPKYIQVMNEINTRFQTGTSFESVVRMIRVTREVFAKDFPDTKIMTTIETSFTKGWKEFTARLMESAGHDLDAIGFDYYPGTWENPAGFPLIGKPPFEAFGGTTPYDWIAEQKNHGMLQGKNVILSETGAMALKSSSKHQRFGYDRIVQALDHFLLKRERIGQGDIFSDIGFFTGGSHRTVDTKPPGVVIDFKPWTIVRKDQTGNWALTNAGSRLKHLIHTRIHPSA